MGEYSALATQTSTFCQRYGLGLTLGLAAAGLLLVTIAERGYGLTPTPALFLPVHLVTELFSIAVSFSVFAVGLYTPREDADPRVRFLGATLLIVGLLDIFHTLSYLMAPGTSWLGLSPNLAVMVWLAARAVPALGLLAVALVPRRWFGRTPGALLYPAALVLAVLVALLAVRWEARLPMVLLSSGALTAAGYKVQLAIIAVMAAAGLVLWLRGSRSAGLSSTHLVKAIIFLAFAELASSVYASVFDIYDLLGHAYRAIGYFYIFQAAFVVNVRHPYENMQQLVAERTADLEKALFELKEADERKDEFVSGLSHDLRTPLVPALGFLEMVLKGRVGPLTDKQREFLGRSYSSVQRQAGMIDELLDYARLRAGRLTLHREEFDLRDLLNDAVKMLEAMAAQQGQRVEAEPCEEPLPVEADRAKLLRVLNNLFSNAVKFNPEGGVVRVKAWRRGGKAAVMVEDTGPGIAPEERERVFERFYQGGAGNGGQVRGSGIGLWVVSEVMRLHGGSVELESEPGKGSRFIVWLAAAAPPHTP
jgi:signal transduction histidine kinase